MTHGATLSNAFCCSSVRILNAFCSCCLLIFFPTNARSYTVALQAMRAILRETSLECYAAVVCTATCNVSPPRVAAFTGTSCVPRSVASLGCMNVALTQSLPSQAVCTHAGCGATDLEQVATKLTTQVGRNQWGTLLQSTESSAERCKSSKSSRMDQWAPPPSEIRTNAPPPPPLIRDTDQWRYCLVGSSNCLYSRVAHNKQRRLATE